ncbi:MAG TPA: biopolymer transporter ExbD [Chitinophagaceae bacterium]|nr:biopolymer transporter ExbD [Chitinophagaceae bacterium]
MADIPNQKGKPPPRVDLTAMVDMNFLLLTFFILSTTLSKPKAMEIVMPYKDDEMTDEDRNKIKKDVALTILLGKNNKVYYYEGIGDDPNQYPDIRLTTFRDVDGIRDVIIAKKQKVEQLKANGTLKASDKATVIIKADTTSTTADFINILDEMTINAIPTYAVVDITEQDQEFIYEYENSK